MQVAKVSTAAVGDQRKPQSLSEDFAAEKKTSWSY